MHDCLDASGRVSLPRGKTCHAGTTIERLLLSKRQGVLRVESRRWMSEAPSQLVRIHALAALGMLLFWGQRGSEWCSVIVFEGTANVELTRASNGVPLSSDFDGAQTARRRLQSCRTDHACATFPASPQSNGTTPCAFANPNFSSFLTACRGRAATPASIR